MSLTFEEAKVKALRYCDLVLEDFRRYFERWGNAASDYERVRIAWHLRQEVREEFAACQSFDEVRVIRDRYLRSYYNLSRRNLCPLTAVYTDGLYQCSKMAEDLGEKLGP